MFARFDALDNRLNGMDERLQSLEAKRHDTKPIWERALTEIAETRAEMRAEFEKSRAEAQTNFRRLERKVEVLNDDLLGVKAEMRELSSHIERLDKSRV